MWDDCADLFGAIRPKPAPRTRPPDVPRYLWLHPEPTEHELDTAVREAEEKASSTYFDLFWKNPYNYHRQMVQNKEYDCCWNRGILSKMKIDPQKFSEMRFSRVAERYRIYSIASWNTEEYDQDSPIGVPRAVYPSFDWQTASLKELNRLINEPWGEDELLCDDKRLPLRERPAYGQPHRIFITNLPNVISIEGKFAIRYLAAVQHNHPELELFINGTDSFSTLFGNNFRAGAFNPSMAGASKIILPNGKRFTVTEDTTSQEPIQRRFLTPMGWTMKELQDGGVRCSFNMQSARYASTHWLSDSRLIGIRPRDPGPVDTESPDARHELPVVITAPRPSNRIEKSKSFGNKILCNICTLWSSCSYYREGSVCAVPGSETRKLAQFFQTRNPDAIAEGVRAIVESAASEVDARVAAEEEDPDNQYSNKLKDLKQLFDMAGKLHGIVSPRGPGVQVNVLNGNVTRAISESDTRAVASVIMKELEQEGYSPDEITDELISQKVNNYKQLALENVVGNLTREAEPINHVISEQ